MQRTAGHRPVTSLQGVIVALATPLRRDGQFDEAGCRRLVRHVIDGGVNGILALGSTGEVAYLDEPTRRAVLRTVVDEAGGTVPVLTGVAQNSLPAARIELAAAQEQGALAAVVAPPFYTPIDQYTVTNFYRALAEKTLLPILLYNIPAFTKVMIAPDTVSCLAQEGAVIGIKDSSGNFEYFEQVLVSTRALAGFRSFTGTDTMLLAALTAGAVGAIALSGNLVPAWALRVQQAFRAGDLVEARRAQDNLLRLVLALRIGVPPSGIKAALEMAGICGPWTAPPIAPLDSEKRDLLRQELTAMGIFLTGSRVHTVPEARG